MILNTQAPADKKGLWWRDLYVVISLQSQVISQLEYTCKKKKKKKKRGSLLDPKPSKTSLHVLNFFLHVTVLNFKYVLSKG